MAGLLELYDKRAATLRQLIEDFAAKEEVDDLVRETRNEFEALIPDIPYADRPGHSMFRSAFGVFLYLAVFKAARRHGYDVHQVGAAFLREPVRGKPGPVPAAALGQMRKDAEESEKSAAPNEFVFEILDGDTDSDWGMNIKSCAVCHAYAKHDAMNLVPYMCASDDIVSDAGGQGLRRTGTIGLGAHHCDFRFKAGGEPLRLVEQYSERIRMRKEDA
jgi:hypothetical protein